MDNKSNNESKGAGLFIFLAVLGIGAVVLLTRRGGNKNESLSYQHSYAEPVAGGWVRVHSSHPSITPSTIPPTTLYENKEEWELVRGPDRLIEKIVIHRMVTQNG
ncbi:hypothetical protein ES703_106807 [subsurface metagenome]